MDFHIYFINAFINCTEYDIYLGTPDEAQVNLISDGILQL